MFSQRCGNLEHRIDDGKLISSEEVYVELERKDDDLHKWMMARKQMFKSLDVEIQQLAASVLAEHPRLVDTLRNRSRADPFVIATAIHQRAVVVTGEIATNKIGKPRIPDVCRAKGIRCINFLELIRDLHLSF